MEAMSGESPSVTNQPMRRLRRAEYDALVALGTFQNERVELVFGQVVAMSPIDPSHARSTTLLEDAGAALATLKELGARGVDLDLACRKLQEEGVAAFAKSFDTLLAAIEGEIARQQGGGSGGDMPDDSHIPPPSDDDAPF